MEFDSIPNDIDIYKSFIVSNSKINSINYENIMCSVSGGADSDIMLDLCYRIDLSGKIKYVFFDTGLEYEATKEHLKYLEDKYKIKIEIVKAEKPIPTTCKQYGQPFLSKQVSEYISRLQKHGFNWVDDEFDVLYKKYPNCKIALQWWCNERGEKSSFNINYNKFLKEFIILNPPWFNISNMCCKYAKKNPAHKFNKNNNIDLELVGIRKAEGGARARSYKSCFDNQENNDRYRPLFWYKENTKAIYENYFKIKHSKCYSDYGLKRTGCAGCPYGKDFEFELNVIKNYEPNLYKAVNNIFKDSYEYTRMYLDFKSNFKE